MTTKMDFIYRVYRLYSKEMSLEIQIDKNKDTILCALYL